MHKQQNNNDQKASYQSSRSITNFGLNKTSSSTVDLIRDEDLKEDKLINVKEINKNEPLNKKLLAVRENAEFRNSMPPVCFLINFF